MDTASTNTKRNSCVGCAHYTETDIRKTGFVRKRCTLGGKPMLPEFALRGHGACGPGRKSFVQASSSKGTPTSPPPAPSVGTGPYSSPLAIMHAWNVDAAPGASSPDGMIHRADNGTLKYRAFSVVPRPTTIGLYPVTVFAKPPGSATYCGPSAASFTTSSVSVSWWEVANAIEALWPNLFHNAADNILNRNSIY